MNDGLKNKHRQTLVDILAANPRVERVVLFGSRAMGTYSPESDIDLALYGDELTLDDLAKLKVRIEETTIPQQVDLILVTDIDNEKLLRHIREQGVEWFRRKEWTGGSEGSAGGDGKCWSMGDKWNYLPFTEAVEVNPSVPLQRGKIYPFVDMKAVESSNRGASESEFREFKGGGARFIPFDTLMARITPCLENGKIARYIPSEGIDGPAFGSTEFIVIHGREGITDNDYAYYLTKWEEFRQFAISQMTGSSGRQRVSTDSLAKFFAPVPRSLSDQRAIAQILGTLDDKIELNRQMNHTLEAMAQALFKSWFVDFDPVVVNALRAGNPVPEKFAQRAAHYRDNPDALRLPEDTLCQFPDRFQDSELGLIPEGWEASTICAEFYLTMGQSPPGTTYNEFRNGMPFFQGRRDFGFRYPSLRVYCTAPTRIASRGDTLVSVRAPVGDINMAYEDCCVGRGLAALRHKSGSRSYTYYAMQSLGEQFKRFEAEGTVFGSINKKQFQDLPSLKVAMDIVSVFENLAFPIDEKSQSNEEEMRSLEKLRDTLLPKLISGELRVPDAEAIIKDVTI